MSKKNIDYKNYIENNSNCIFVETYIEKGRRQLKLICECGEKFSVAWVRFNRKDVAPQRQCKKCGEKFRLSHNLKRKKTDEQYNLEKSALGILIKNLEPYNGRNKKIKHECPVCHEDWYVTPGNILTKSSTKCQKCNIISGYNKLSDIEYTEKKKSLNIDIKHIEQYNGMDISIKHECPVCHEDWYVTPGNILTGNSKRCVKCSYLYRGENQKLSNEQVNDLIESKGCIWIDGEYIEKDSILTYQCECGNIFKRRFHDFNSKDMFRCSKCSNKLSIGEYQIKKYLEEHSIKYNQQQTFDELKGDYGLPLYYDFSILGENNEIIELIEFDGMYHFKPVFSRNKDLAVERYKRQVKYDKRKNEYAKKNNIPLLRIKYNQYKNISSILDEHFK